MNIFQGIKKFFGIGSANQFKKLKGDNNAPSSIPPADNRYDRYTTRRRWHFMRRTSQRIGPPVLTGLRLERVTKSCLQGK
jgi:hypothetical protein